MSTVKTVLCFSGGLDSTVLLYHLKYRLGNEVYCLSIDYGQRHVRELLAAQRVIETVDPADWKQLNLANVREVLLRSSQTLGDVPVPEGHYAEESMKATVVPNRNMVLLSLATAWAVSLKAQCVAYAAHAGDHAIYPDCRPAFADAMETAIALCDWTPPLLVRPFVAKSKTDLVKLGSELGVPFAKTYSCYNGREKHCGKCGTCTERIEAFQLAGVPDPTEYE